MLLLRYDGALADSSHPAHAMGAFSYSSGLSDHGEGDELAACLPGMPTQVRYTARCCVCGRHVDELASY